MAAGAADEAAPSSPLWIRCDKGLSFLENVAVILAGLALMTSMLLVAVNALLRHVFGAPLSFQLELTESYLLVILIAMAMPWGFRHGGFIRITLFSDWIPGVLWRASYRIGLLFSAAYMGLLGLRAYRTFHHVWVNNEQIMGVIDWPVAWSWIWIPLGCWLLAARVALQAFSRHELSGH